MRRPIAAAAALALLAEAGVIGFVVLVLGLSMRRQHMSLGGLDPGAESTGAWTFGAVLGLYLLVCAWVELRTAMRDRAPGRRQRLLLVICAVVHGLLGAAVVGMAGWGVFTVTMIVLALLVATLIGYPRISATDR